MLLRITLLLLAAVLDQSLGQEEPEETEEEVGENGVVPEETEEEIGGSGVSPEVQQEIINRHNAIRRQVKPPASNMLKMVWSEAIGERARKWVQQCKLQMSPKEERQSNDTLCGETVFQANYVNSWTEVINFWNEKKVNFKYGVGAIDPRQNIYPYTQLIWYNSYRIGCAATYCEGTKFPYYYICQYCPAGNLQDEMAKPYKRGKPCGDCPNDCENKLCTNPCERTNISRDCKTMKKLFSCKSTIVKKNCAATCYCKKSIV